MVLVATFCGEEEGEEEAEGGKGEDKTTEHEQQREEEQVRRTMACPLKLAALHELAVASSRSCRVRRSDHVSSWSTSLCRRPLSVSASQPLILRGVAMWYGRPRTSVPRRWSSRTSTYR